MDRSEVSSLLGVHHVYQRSNSQQKYVAPGLVCLMLAIALERITFYIVTTNMSDFFMSALAMNDSQVPVATATYLVFTGTTDFLPLFGGMIGDSMISRYACTLIGFLIETVGSIFLLVLMIINDELSKVLGTTTDYALVFTGLTLMAIGLGFHRANVLTVGCEQVCQYVDQKENVKAVEKFFRGYYWVTNIGALIAFIIISIAESTGNNSEKPGQHKPAYYLGIIQTATLILGIFFIIVGKRWYIRTTPDGGNLRNLSRAFFRKCTFFIRYIRRKAAVFTGSGSSQQQEQNTEDETLMHVFRIILVTSSLIMFQIIFALEFGSIFFLQGQVMDYHPDNVTIPLQIMKSFDSITIIVVLPIIHFLITPFLVRKNRNITLLKRMGAGLLFGCASAGACGVVETVRNHYFPHCSGTCFSIFWQVPQFVFLSLGEIFVFITSYQFMYLESPPNLQGLVVGLGFCLRGLGSYLAQAILAIILKAKPNWYPTPDNFNNIDHHVAYLLYLLAGLQLVFFLIFVWHAYGYPYKYLYKETDGNATRTMGRSPIQAGFYTSNSSLGSITHSYDSIDSLLPRGH